MKLKIISLERAIAKVLGKNCNISEISLNFGDSNFEAESLIVTDDVIVSGGGNRSEMPLTDDTKLIEELKQSMSISVGDLNLDAPRGKRRVLDDMSGFDIDFE